MSSDDDRLTDAIDKIDREIEALRAATKERIAALKEQRKPLVTKRRVRDRAADAHCLALYASTALMLMKAGDVGAHELTKRVLQHLRQTDRHRRSLRNWPRLEEAFAGYRSASDARKVDASAAQSEPTADQDRNAHA